MRYLWGAFTLLCFTFLLGAEGAREKAPPSADSHAQKLYAWLKRKDPAEACNFRALSYYNYAQNKAVGKRVKSMRFWINQLHLESAVSFAEEVPGTDGLLYAIDLRELGWNAESWSAIARREPYFREPAVDSATAILLRKMIGVDQDPKTLHAEAIVRADWFFRETMEADRSPSYYDALFAKFRFGKTKTVTETVVVTPEKKEIFRHTDGYMYERTIPAVKKEVTRKVGGFQDFPKNEAEFEKVFAVDKFRAHLKEFKIDTRHGAVVEGQEKGVSIVARQNRLVERIITNTGSYYKAYDVKETTGKRDFAETLNKDFEFDAGEILTDTPCGGLAALLVDKKGNIVQTADNRFATDTSDLKFDARVRTPGSCFICHEQKFIKPQNLVEDMLKSGIDILFKKKDKAVGARAFFLDWQDKLETEQTRFTKFIQRTSGFRPGENALQLKIWRDEYDAPVTLKVAAAEMGLTEADFKLVAVNSTKARILMLVRGLSIPRRTWEVDGYKEMVLQLNASKK
jgi:hypothetical protein